MNIVQLFRNLVVTLFIASASAPLFAKEKAIAPSDVPPLSVQLWSVKDAVKEDFEGTLKSIADMGFNGVEFANEFGPYSEDPAGLKQFLNSLDLKASGAHVMFDKLTEVELDKTIKFYKALGVELIIVPWDERAWHPEGVVEVVAELNELADQLAPHGMKIGFHNHDQEFNSFKDKTYWDYIAQNTKESVVLQLDVGWVNFAGYEPTDFVKRYKHRTLTTHYKVRTKDGSGQSPIIGKDGYDWTKLIKTNVVYGGTQWIVVEQEEYPEGMTSMESVKKSKEGVKKAIQILSEQ